MYDRTAVTKNFQSNRKVLITFNRDVYTKYIVYTFLELSYEISPTRYFCPCMLLLQVEKCMLCFFRDVYTNYTSLVFFLKSDVKDEHVKMKSCCDIETEGSQLMLK